MDYKFNFIKLPEEHGFDDEHLKFLQVLDEGLVKSREGISNKDDLTKIKEEWDKNLADMKNNFNYEKIQKQINDIYVRMQDSPIVSEKDKDRKERELNNKWLRSLVKRNISSMEAVNKELKTYAHEPVMHLGPGSDVLDEDFTQGGYLVPQLLETQIQRFVEEHGVARRDMRYLPFSGAGNSRYIPTLLTSVSVGWIGEGEVKPKTKPTIFRVQQILRKLAAITIFTEEITEDAAVDLVAFCGPLFAEAIALEEDNQFLAGIGNPWLGVLNAVGVVPVTMQPGVRAENLRPEHLEAMTHEVPRAARAGGKFYMHGEIFALLRTYRSSAIAANDREGVYLVQDPQGVRPASLWGYPIVETDVLPTFAEAQEPDTPFLIFSNLQRTCVYGDKQGIRVKMLDQASLTDVNDQQINLAEQDMLAMRVHKRVGYVPVLPSGIAVLYTGPVS